VSKKDTTKKDKPPKKWQQPQQQNSVRNNTSNTSDFDSAWASFSDSPFDNSFSSGNPFANGGVVEWPDDDDDGVDIKKSNNDSRVRGKNAVSAKPEAAKSVVTSAPTATNTIKTSAARATSQSKPRPQKEPVIKNDDEVEFWGVESDEVTNLTNLNDDWGEIQSEKEADIAALFKYRSGGKGEKATTGSSSSGKK
ncbi:MAG: hypothetical protein GY874_17960, partial [Desulfobacteraceae bacterium]|nr:hypothetical protein [Desulfobacteraceae bacterium]